MYAVYSRVGWHITVHPQAGRRTSKKVIPVEELLTVALGISTGMSYLHDR